MPRRRDPDIPHADELAWSFGRRVSSLRRRGDLDREELARLSGMSTNYLWRIEQGLIVPNLRNIARLALALEVPLSFLLENIDISKVRLENRSYTRREKSSDLDA
jgi:transcriptional regulator with XRE-family HTH domain